MAVDYGMLARVPTIGSRIMAGQEAGRAAAAQNMLLQQRAMEFQQAQEDRQRRLREEQIFNQAAEMIRQSGLDPEDPKVLQQFTAAAVQSRNPQLMSLATTMSERMAKRRQERADAAAVAAIAARRRGEAPAGAPAPAEAAPMLEAPAAVAAPVLEAPPPEVSPVARAQAEQPRPYFYGQGTFAGTEPTAMAAPVGAGIEPVRTDLPAQDMYADLAAANKLAPPAPVVNRMMAAPAPAPAVQVAGPAAMPAAPKVDVDKLQKQLDDLQEDYDEYSGLGTEAGRKAAAALKPQMGRLERQIRDASKTKERESPLMRDVVAFGFEPTADGLAKFEAAKRDPDTVGTKEYNLAVKQGFKGTLLDYKKELAEAGRTKVNVGVQAFEPASIQAQKEFISAASKQRETLINAPNIIENVNAAKQLIPSASAFMGKGGEPLLTAASFLNNRLGFSINTKGVTDATELNTRLFEGILENLKRLDSQPTQQQQNALREALGSLGTDPAALPRILDRIEDSLRNRVDRYNKDVTSAQQRGVTFPYDPLIELPPRVRPAAIPTAPAAAPAPAPAAAAAPAAGRAFPAPPQTAIDMLKSGKGTDAQFDAIFGPGAAARARGGR